MSDEEIDVVITWVDGNDPNHLAKRKAYQDRAPHVRPSAVSDTRFDDCGEIYFCIASILKYAPYIRKIFVVTDNQEPSLIQSFVNNRLCEKNRIQIVDHRHIFRGYSDYLPTFNSRSIETMIWRIDGLSEYFVSFNDDFFLNQPVTKETFFLDGYPVLNGVWRKSKLTSLSYRVRSSLAKVIGKKTGRKANFHTIQNRAGVLAGFANKFFLYDHTPRPVRKSVLRDYFRENESILKKQIQHRFRADSQFTPMSLAYHIELKEFGVKPNSPASLAYFHPTEKPELNWFDLVRDETTAFGCVQSLDECPTELRVRMIKLLVTKFQDFLPVELLDNRDYGI